MTNTVAEMKNAFHGIISRCNAVEERIDEQDKSIEITQTETHKIWVCSGYTFFFLSWLQRQEGMAPLG